MAVAHILKHKGSTVYTVSPRDNVQAIVDTLARHRIGAVLVVDEGGGILGIVSERDVVRANPEDIVAADCEVTKGLAGPK